MKREQGWTREPWETSDAPGKLLGVIDSGNALIADASPSDARRIVQCINACAGLNDPAAELTRLRAIERAALDACKADREWVNNGQLPSGLDAVLDSMETLRTALESGE